MNNDEGPVRGPWRPRLFPDTSGLCGGRIVPFIPDESSWRCTKCGWIGWPRQDVDQRTGRIIRQYPHPLCTD